MFIPELKTLTLEGKPVTNETEYLKELSTGIYIELYSSWINCSDSKDRSLTRQRLMATVVLLSLWKDNKPYLRECVTVPQGEDAPELPDDLGPLMRHLTADQIVIAIDEFADSTPDPFMNKLDAIIDKEFGTLSHLKGDKDGKDDGGKK